METAYLLLVFNMSEINVLYVFDSNFWRMATVSINSLLANKSPNTHVNIHCMVAPRTRGHCYIKRIVSKYSNAKLIWRSVNNRHSPYRGVDYSRWSPVIFYRLFAYRLFPNIEKMLYIDSDTLVQHDLSELYNTDISNYALAAVRDMAPLNLYPEMPDVKVVRAFKEKYQKHDLYINSGVLLMNMQRIRESETRMTSVDIPLKYPDQDIINYVFDGKMLELPLKYNCIPFVHIDPKFSESEQNMQTDEIVIGHFYAGKPYVYDLTPRPAFAMYSAAARAVGMYPDQFVADDRRRFAKKYTTKTVIPFLRIDKNGRVRFFGIRL